MASSKPTVMFSPGAFHPPSVFDTVRGVLSSRGFGAEAAALPTVGTTDETMAIHHDCENLHSILTKLVDEGKEIVLTAG
ncbi:hypothetical protein ONZ43_g5427 [Nemania bipapillata]|uniref:Uncharacterized protein n=1 Tax=Nemania bipapillata TaxID=110536 RepID=A0ACC2IAX3_9PEZI|nr:hypothetical protein ONZ43_g5427 [Nemania bipapillata]